jgi:hypothetical protein
MKKVIIAASIAAALTGCGTTTTSSNSMFGPSEWRQGSDNVDTSIAPAWFTEYRTKDDANIFAVASEYSTDMQFAIDKANLSAKRQIAAQMDSTISSMMKDYATESGSSSNAEVMREVERVTRQVTAKAQIIGFKRDRFEIKREGKGYRVFSRMIFPYDDSNKILAETIRRNKMLKLQFDKSEAYRELDHHTGTESYEPKQAKQSKEPQITPVAPANEPTKSLSERAKELPHNTISDPVVKSKVEAAIARGDAVIMTHTVN